MSIVNGVLLLSASLLAVASWVGIAAEIRMPAHYDGTLAVVYALVLVGPLAGFTVVVGALRALLMLRYRSISRLSRAQAAVCVVGLSSAGLYAAVMVW
jgi:hypothetical protein